MYEVEISYVPQRITVQAKDMGEAIYKAIEKSGPPQAIGATAEWLG